MNRFFTSIALLIGICAAMQAQEADSLLAQVAKFSKEKKFQNVIELIEPNLSIFNSDSLYLIAIDYLTTAYSSEKKYDKIELLLSELSDKEKKITGVKNQQYFNKIFKSNLLKLANYYRYDNKDYNKAETCILKLLSASTEDKIEYLTQMIGLGELYVMMRDYKKEGQTEAQIEAFISRNAIDKKSENVKILRRLSNLYKSSMNITKGEDILLKISKLTEQNKDTNYKEHIKSLYDLFTVYTEMGDYNEAEKYLLSMFDITQSKFQNTDTEYIRDLYHLVNFYQQQKRDFQKAEEYLTKILDATQNKPSIQCNALINMAALFIDKGDFEKAENYLLKAQQYYYDNKLSYADYNLILKKFSELYNKTSQREKSEQYLIKLAENTKKEKGNNSIEYLNSLQYLANFYVISNDMETPKAEKRFLEIMNICQEALDIKNLIFYINSLYKLGLIQEKYGNYTQALQYLVLSCENLEKSEKREGQYAFTIAHTAEIYTKLGKYKEAEDCLVKALELTKKVGNDRTQIANVLFDLSAVYQSTSRYEEALKAADEGFQIFKNRVNYYFSYYSSNQRNKYWATMKDKTDLLFSLFFDYSNYSTGLSFNNALFTKGLLLRVENNLREAIINSGDSILLKKYAQFEEVQKQIEEAPEDDDDKDTKTKTLESLTNGLLRYLNIASQKYQNTENTLPASWQDVQKQLLPTDAAVEFVSFRLYDKQWTDSTMYAALVLRAGMKSPEWIPLCEQKELQSVLQTGNQDTQEQTQSLYTDKGKEIYQLIWQKLEKELPDVKNIYYSPSGLLYKIAFNALPTDKESILLSDKYNLQLVSSTREIERLKKETAAASVQDTTVVYGGLAYDAQQSAMLAAAKRYSSDTQENENADRFVDRLRKNDGRRDAELPDSTLRGGFSEWKYLAGTKTETEQIVQELNNKHIPNQYYTEDNGNEESFKHLSGTKTSVIHLSTHGFFFPDIENQAVEDIVQQLGGNREKPFENPLLRSGLIMSGANNQWLAKEYIMKNDIEDGILTADEISRLNLTKTKLVVLSACETGLGDVKNSEGVFGLQRAFKLAGVESLIMSLWKVPDEATAELMTTFYSEWLGGKTKQSAFKAAQQRVREKYKSPYYWAAFVMMD